VWNSFALFRGNMQFCVDLFLLFFAACSSMCWHVLSHESCGQPIIGAHMQFAVVSFLALLEIELVDANASSGWRLEMLQPVYKRHLHGGVMGNDTFLFLVTPRCWLVELSS